MYKVGRESCYQGIAHVTVGILMKYYRRRNYKETNKKKLKSPSHSEKKFDEWIANRAGGREDGGGGGGDLNIYISELYLPKTNEEGGSDSTMT